MDMFTSREFYPLWALLLAGLLFLPVRQLIFVLFVRRWRKRNDGAVPDADMLARLKARAGFSGALICVIFSLFYTATLFPR